MRRRVLLYLTLIAVSACNGDKVVQPIASPTSPTKAISDGNHCVGSSTSCVSGNPEFFFLPPMVPDPTGTTYWSAGAFNPGLAPTVEICPTAAAGAACTLSPAPSYPATLRASDEQYAYNWKVPTDPQIYYRITVSVGGKSLGFADVQAGTAAEVKNMATGQFIPLVDGRTLPIKFRIERYALCTDPLAGGCTSASADISTTPLIVSSGTPTSNANGISDVKGVAIPPQGGTDHTPVTATFETCPDLGPVIHRQTIGDCVRVTLDPARTLTNAATVFICSIGLATPGLPDVDPEQIRMYRSDAQGVVALAPAHACQPGSPGGVVASASSSLHDVFASLAHGRFTLAAKAAVALISPKPLYAARFIDLGGGGFSDSFSDFEFVLPTISGFEASEPTWSSSAGAFWHTTTLLGLTNGAVPSLVSLPTGDNSNGALPAPHVGAQSLWFGENATGNYAGTLASSTQLGGTSTVAHAGTATSPEFVVPLSTNTVRVGFWSWFEIESVNPSGFDLMQVRIRESGDHPEVVLLQLNPSGDPVDGTANTPYTSGGFNLPPVWQQRYVDISAFKGKSVTLSFAFDTGDQLYNAFRGWIVDDVTLHTDLVSTGILIPLRSSFDVAPSANRPVRAWRP